MTNISEIDRVKKRERETSRKLFFEVSGLEFWNHFTFERHRIKILKGLLPEKWYDINIPFTGIKHIKYARLNLTYTKNMKFFPLFNHPMQFCLCIKESLVIPHFHSHWITLLWWMVAIKLCLQIWLIRLQKLTFLIDFFLLLQTCKNLRTLIMVSWMHYATWEENNTGRLSCLSFPVTQMNMNMFVPWIK